MIVYPKIESQKYGDSTKKIHLKGSPLIRNCIGWYRDRNSYLSIMCTPKLITVD